jgi:predicted MPP superfamily phosphohydrolase/uncharacterized membrane protein
MSCDGQATKKKTVFLLNEILWSLPLVGYSVFRVVRLLRRTLTRVLFVVGFLAVLAGFPVAESLSHRGAVGAGHWIMMAGWYGLPLLLYFVLVVVPLDLVLGCLRLTRVLSKATVTSPRFRSVRLGVYLVLPVLIVAGGIVNFRTIRIHRYTIEVPRREASVDRLRVVFASDFHLSDRTSARFMQTFAAKVNAQEPDIVLIGGDVFEGDRREEDRLGFERGFRALRAKYGVFGVLGNHEGYRGGQTDFFERAGIRLLRDEVVRVDRALILAGRRDGSRRRRGNPEPGRASMAELLRGTVHDLPLVVLDHRPVDNDAISRAGADIQLSGHTHRGQLFPVNFITHHRYEIDNGYKLKGTTHVFVSTGVQLWGPPVRTTGSSEILVIDVRLK